MTLLMAGPHGQSLSGIGFKWHNSVVHNSFNRFFFKLTFLKKDLLFIYLFYFSFLAALGLSCDTWDLH